MSTPKKDTQITQAAFERLPMLIPRATFLAWSGYSDQDLSAAIKAGQIKTHRSRPDSRKVKYYKTQLVEICRLKW